MSADIFWTILGLCIVFTIVGFTILIRSPRSEFNWHEFVTVLCRRPGWEKSFHRPKKLPPPDPLAVLAAVRDYGPLYHTEVSKIVGFDASLLLVQLLHDDKIESRWGLDNTFRYQIKAHPQATKPRH